MICLTLSMHLIKCHFPIPYPSRIHIDEIIAPQDLEDANRRAAPRRAAAPPPLDSSDSVVMIVSWRLASVVYVVD